jgi:hypothetical protein
MPGGQSIHGPEILAALIIIIVLIIWPLSLALAAVPPAATPLAAAPPAAIATALAPLAGARRILLLLFLLILL